MSKFTSVFKAKVDIEAIKENETVIVLVKRYNVSKGSIEPLSRIKFINSSPVLKTSLSSTTTKCCITVLKNSFLLWNME